MRLLHVKTGEFVDFPDEAQLPTYAILSHTWDPQGEQSYQNVKEIHVALLAVIGTSPPPASSLWDDPRLSAKVRMACTVARADRKSTRLNSSHSGESRMPSSA